MDRRVFDDSQIVKCAVWQMDKKTYLSKTIGPERKIAVSLDNGYLYLIEEAEFVAKEENHIIIS